MWAKIFHGVEKVFHGVEVPDLRVELVLEAHGAKGVRARLEEFVRSVR
jgi:hypothetical protein